MNTKIVPSVNIPPVVMFTGSDEEIEQYEEQCDSVKTFWKELMTNNEFTGCELLGFTKRRILLTPGLKQGILWRLSFFHVPNENNLYATMHEDYRTIDEVVDALLQHCLNKKRPIIIRIAEQIKVK